MKGGGQASVPQPTNNPQSDMRESAPERGDSAACSPRPSRTPHVAGPNLSPEGEKLKSSAIGGGSAAPTQGVRVAAKAVAKAPNQNPKKKRGASFWVAIVVAVVAIVLACILAFTMCGKSARQGDEGQLEGKTPEEIQAELDRQVEEGMFNISIASVIEFPDGTSLGEVRIENVPGNIYTMKVEITRDDTGEVIYSTDFIDPNHHIQSDTLDVDLEAGDYDCTAMFYAYDIDTEELIGQAAAKVNIRVLG